MLIKKVAALAVAGLLPHAAALPWSGRKHHFKAEIKAFTPTGSVNVTKFTETVTVSSGYYPTLANFSVTVPSGPISGVPFPPASQITQVPDDTTAIFTITDTQTVDYAHAVSSRGLGAEIAAETSSHSMVTASFTLTLPPDFPTTFTADPSVMSSLLGLPTDISPTTCTDEPETTPAVPEHTTTETVSITDTEIIPCPITTTTTETCETEEPTATSTEVITTVLPITVTSTKTTSVTVTTDIFPTTAPLSSPSGAPYTDDLVTLTYTIPGGPGHSSRVVTLTTELHRPPPPPTSPASVPTINSILPPPQSSNSSSVFPTSSLSYTPPLSTGTGAYFSLSQTFINTYSVTPTLKDPLSVLTMTTTQSVFSTVFATASDQEKRDSRSMPTMAAEMKNAFKEAAVPDMRISQRDQSAALAALRPAHLWIGHDTSQKTSKKVSRQLLHCFTDNMRIVHNFDSDCNETMASLALSFDNGFRRVANQPMKYIPSSMPGMMYREAGDTVESARISLDNACKRFSLVSWNLGCDSTDQPCKFTITGRRTADEGDKRLSTVVATQTFTVNPCFGDNGCRLSLISIDPAKFSGLSSFTVDLAVGDDQTRAWWADDLDVAYTCVKDADCRA